MSIKRIDDGSEDSLPWVNDYIDEVGQADDCSFVTSLRKTPKGYLVLAKDFKGFVFSGSKLYDFLVEVIPHWRQDGRLSYGVFAIAQQNGKVGLAVDDEVDSVAVVDKKGNVDFKSTELILSSSQETSNPFMKGLTTPPTTDSEGDKKPRSRTQSHPKNPL